MRTTSRYLVALTAALGFDGDLEEAKGKADVDRAATLRQRLKQNARRASRTFDAVEFALSLGVASQYLRKVNSGCKASPACTSTCAPFRSPSWARQAARLKFDQAQFRLVRDLI